MNCNKVEIWLDEQSDLRDASLPTDVRGHIATCDSCFSKLKLLKQTYSFIEEQSNTKLSEAKQNEIIAALSENAARPTRNFFIAADWISKVAAILIIGVGVLLGVVLAQKYLMAPSEESLWSSEFSMISENVDTGLFDD